MDLESIRNVPLLEELRLKSNNGMSITGVLNPLQFCRLKHLVSMTCPFSGCLNFGKDLPTYFIYLSYLIAFLFQSLTSVKNLASCNIEIISELTNLESLELGDCIKLSDDFGPDHLSK